MKTLPSYVVVTPVRDEGAPYQSDAGCRRYSDAPARKLDPVDDGSSDGTGALLDRRAAGVSWIDVIHRPDRGRRAPG